MQIVTSVLFLLTLLRKAKAVAQYCHLNISMHFPV